MSPLPILSSFYTPGTLTDTSDWYTKVAQPLSDALVGLLGDTDWVTPTLGNSWVNFGSPFSNAGYRIQDGVVYLKGTIKSGTVATIFTLPAGYRPGADSLFVVPANVGTGRIDIIAATGAVNMIGYSSLAGAVGNNADVGLTNISFIAEN